jgi:hypothetical protein
MTPPGDGAAAGDDTHPGEGTDGGGETPSGEGETAFIPKKVVPTVQAHICFSLKDKPLQLLNALRSLMNVS